MAIGGASIPPWLPNGLIPALQPLAQYSWVVGLVVSFLLYGVLTMVLGKRSTVESPEPATAPAATA
jgi:cytosine/uracil/thiamine/allantoin permease